MGAVLGITHFEGNERVSPFVRPQNETCCTEVSSQNSPSVSKYVTGLGLKVPMFKQVSVFLQCLAWEIDVCDVQGPW